MTSSFCNAEVDAFMKETDSQRLGRWFDAYSARLTLYVRQWVDRSAAEDIVQDVFLRLLARPCEVTNEKALLFTAARHAAIDEQRSRQRRVHREQVVQDAQPSWFDPQPDVLIDAASAEQALARLLEPQREVILLRIWGGLTLEEISRVTGEPVSTLFSRYKAGLAEIRNVMEMSCKTKTT